MVFISFLEQVFRLLLMHQPCGFFIKTMSICESTIQVSFSTLLHTIVYFVFQNYRHSVLQ